MLNKNFRSDSGSEHGKRTGRFWTAQLRGVFSSLAFVALFPAALAAQFTTSIQQTTPQAAVYGSGVQTPLLFEGETVPVNQVFLSMGVLGFYDDNVFGRNSQRVGDEAISLNPRFGITKQSDRLKITFDYMPAFILYRQLSQFDRTNHYSDLSLTYRLTSHITADVHDNFSYQEGDYPFLSTTPILSGPSSPTSPTQQILAYASRMLTNSAGLDLTFAKTRRTLFILSGGYNLLKYESQVVGQPLYNGIGLNGSLLIEHFVTERTKFGLLLLHQDTTYTGGTVFGNRLRSQIESAYLSVGSRLSPTVFLTVFGGPQYLGTVGRTPTSVGVPGHLQGSGGGSLTKEVRKTALDLTFQRSVSGSGGLYTSVESTIGTFAARRQLVGNWEADVHFGVADQDASLFKLANGKTEGLFGGVSISRPLSHGSVFHVSYDSMHQLSKGSLPIVSNFDRNLISVGIDYRFKALPLGR
jgi:hypothetical protein